MRTTLLLMLIWPAAPALADVPGPNDELCTVEVQERDGSNCQPCGYPGFDPEGTPNACDALEEQGLHRRCAIGATAVQVVYCDREANWLSVGAAEPAATAESAEGCGCTAVGAEPHPVLPSILLAAGALYLSIRRRRG